MTDIVGEAIPNWIMAGTSLFTLGAAVTAGIYAGKAAHWTEKQAHASNAQVEIAKKALEIARAEAKDAQDAARRQELETQAAYRRYEESKLDSAMPVVLATVKRSGWFLETKEAWEDGQWTPNWETFSQTRFFEEDQNYRIIFRIRLNVHLENTSQQIARVDIVDPAHGEVTVRGGESIIVPPHQERVFTWTRTFTPLMLATDNDINDAKNWLFDLTLWVRDLGMNVRDTYKFNSDLRLFQRDGSRLIVRPTPEHDWNENVAQPLPERIYERLESNRSMSVHLSGSGNLTAEAQQDPL